MKIEHIRGDYSILQIDPTLPIPQWVYKSPFFSITKTTSEISIVCMTNDILDPSLKVESHWSLLKVLGPLDFSLTGILSSIALPLANKKISLFALSTFDTDYILVKEINIKKSLLTLQEAGFEIINLKETI